MLMKRFFLQNNICLDIKIENINLNLEIAEVNNEVSVKLGLEAKFPKEKTNKKCNSDHLTSATQAPKTTHGNLKFRLRAPSDNHKLPNKRF